MHPNQSTTKEKKSTSYQRINAWTKYHQEYIILLKKTYELTFVMSRKRQQARPRGKKTTKKKQTIIIRTIHRLSSYETQILVRREIKIRITSTRTNEEKKKEQDEDKFYFKPEHSNPSKKKRRRKNRTLI